VKIVPDMTYNVFGGTLNLAQSISQLPPGVCVFVFQFVRLYVKVAERIFTKISLEMNLWT